jgi:threonine 3-dehydrogenase
MVKTMQAVVKTRPEKGAELQEVPLPQIREHEVLVKVVATSICGTDVHIYGWDAWSDQRIGAGNLPPILGHEVAGHVVEAGSAVRRLREGDYVSAETHIPCGRCIPCLTGQQHICTDLEILGVDRDGAFAGYIAIPEVVCWPNHKSIPPEVASIQEPLGNATYALLGEDNDIAGRSVAIVGDGPIGLFAVGVARCAGATPIFLLGLSDFNLEIGRMMGADHVLNAEGDPEPRRAFVREHTYGAGADIVLDMAGSPVGIAEGFGLLRKGGRFSAFGITSAPSIDLDYNNALVFKGAQVHGINGRRMFDTWYRVRNLLSSGRLDVRPVITDLLRLEDFAEGFARMTAWPRRSAKIVLFPEQAEFEAALARQKTTRTKEDFT